MFIVAAAAALGVAVPAFAAVHLHSRIDEQLAPGLTAALGQAVNVDDVEAGPTGELLVYGLRVGDFLRVRRIAVIADIDDALAGHLRIAEVHLDRPRLSLRADADGRTQIDEVRAHFARTMAGKARARGSAQADSRIRSHALSLTSARLSATAGQLSLELDSIGRLTADNISLHPHGAMTRVVAPTAAFTARRGAVEVDGALSKLAADIDLRTARIHRVVAVDGHARARAGEEPLHLEELSLLGGVDQFAQPGLRLSARVAESVASDAGKDAERDGGPPGARQDDLYGDLTIHLSGSLAEPRLMLSGVGLPLAALYAYLPSGMRTRRATFTGSFGLDRARTSHGPVLTTSLDGAIDGLLIADRRVSRTPFVVDVDARLHAHLTGDRAAPTRALIVDELSLASAGFTVAGQLDADFDADFSGRAPGWLPARTHVRLRVPRTHCATALGALPMPFRSQLHGLDLSGSVSARVDLELIGDRPADTQLNLDIDDRDCRVVRDALLADPRVLQTVAEHVFPDGSRRQVGPGQDSYATLSSLPRHLVDGYVASEDARFYRHRGFDVSQIERSLAADIKARAFVRGGSTISQQLVKNAFLSPERTLARKAQEAVLTWRVESVLGKRQLLERYLNIIELGPGIFGVEAAARYWFGKPATELDVLQSAFMVTLTPAPRTVSRRVRSAGGIDDATRRRMDRVLDIMRRHRVIDNRQYERALTQRLTLRSALLAAR